MDIKQEVIGKWPGILASLGIDVGDGRHTKCPVCKTEKLHFRMDDKEGSGSWICTCGAGDGWSLVQKVLGIDFKEAIAEVGKIVGNVEKGTVLPEKKIDPETLRKMFLDSKPIDGTDFVSAYLRGRGLNTFPPALRAINKCWNSELHKEIPAMLAVVMSPENEGVTMHRTYLTMEGNKASVSEVKKLMPCLKKSTGSAIRLFDQADGKIGITEGIETAIACAELFHVPTWAAVSSTILEGFMPPQGIKEVFVFGDNDANFVGQKAAYTLANRLILQHKIQATVLIPERRGDDWLDELNRQRTKGE